MGRGVWKFRSRHLFVTVASDFMGENGLQRSTVSHTNALIRPDSNPSQPDDDATLGSAKPPWHRFELFQIGLLPGRGFIRRSNCRAPIMQYALGDCPAVPGSFYLRRIQGTPATGEQIILTLQQR